jgi:hypothetical protein
MKTKRHLVSALLVVSAIQIGCSPQTQTTETQEELTDTPALTLLWETPAELTTNESVLYDASSGTIYVSNIEGDPSEKDGKGSISKINKSGEITERNWVTGLNAPKGMGISNGKLYVTDIDQLLEIDLASGSISNRFEVENAKFLNDVDTHGNLIYFSDMETGIIHILENGQLRVFAENQSNINGLKINNEGILFGLDNAGLKKYDANGNTEIINSAVTGGDGLVILDNNTFIASRWKGEIYYIRDGKEVKILDTQAEESNTADITFIPEERMLLVPTFFKDKVRAYRLDY